MNQGGDVLRQLKIREFKLEDYDNLIRLWQLANLPYKSEGRLDELGIEIIACLVEDWNKGSMDFFKNTGYVKHEDIYYFSKRKRETV